LQVAGAADREGAAHLASERLAVLSDADLRAKMNADGVFERVVREVIDYACAGDPWS
jgi:hypothetical protein